LEKISREIDLFRIVSHDVEPLPESEWPPYICPYDIDGERPVIKNEKELEEFKKNHPELIMKPITIIISQSESPDCQ